VILPLVAVLGLSALGVVTAWWAGGSLATRAEAIDPTSPVRAAALAYVVFYVLGSVVLLLTGESQGAGPLFAAGSLAAFGAGAALGRRILGPPAPMPPPVSIGVSWPWVAGMTVVGLVSIAVLIAQHGLPLIASDPLASRAGFAGPAFDSFRWLVPPAAVLAVALAVARGDPRDRTVALAALLAVGGLEVLLASRALPAELAIDALLVAYWAGRRLSARTWLALGAAGLVLFVGIQLIRAGADEGPAGVADAPAFAVRRTIDRVILIHPRTLEVVATTIPGEEPYFGGSTYVRRLAVLLGQQDRPSLGYWLYEHLFPGQPGGFAAPGVAGEAWANGGLLLVVAIMTALGAMAAWLGRAVARLPGGPADRAYAALVVVAVARTYATSLNGFLLTLIAAAAWWFLASGRLARAVRR
jgi:hypothetical protein